MNLLNLNTMETIEELKKKIAELTEENGKLKSDLHESKELTENYKRWYKDAGNKYTALVKKVKAWSEWMSEEKQEMVRACLVHCGRKNIGGENKRAVIATDKDGNEYWFESVADAARKLNLCRRNVQHVADGQRNHCGGWRFRHTNSIQH